VTLDHIGKILSPIPDGAPEMAEVGELFRARKFQSSEFVIQGPLYERQCFSIPISVAEEIIHDLQFRMPEVMIHVSKRCDEFNLVLHFQNRD